MQKVSPILQINTKYHQITRHNQMIAIMKNYKYNSNNNKRSYYSETTPQKLDVVEISVEGLNALKKHEQSATPTQITPTNTSYLSSLIANYEKSAF